MSDTNHHGNIDNGTDSNNNTLPSPAPVSYISYKFPVQDGLKLSQALET